MNWYNLLPLFMLFSSLIPGVIIFFLREESHTWRNFLNLGGAVAKIIFILAMLVGIYYQHSFEFRLQFLPGIDLVLNADALSMLFATLSALLWFLTTIYAIGYFRGTQNQSRFFGFFSLCVCATVGIALSGNLVTFLFFYEILTLTTYPLVVHPGSNEALRGGRIYLIYTFSGGALLLFATAWLVSLAGSVSFSDGNSLAAIQNEHQMSLTIIFYLFVLGFGVKAAMFPLHGWLPIAMVAPAPVSALLHAVAVVKAGVFGIVRIFHDVYGPQLATDLGVVTPLAVMASFTILYGSLRALFQDNLKQRLAYSTISQLSYIVLGIALSNPLAATGGLVHLVHQGIMKVTLFFSAGNLSATLGLHHVSRMKGVGRRLPWTMTAFTIDAFGMIGIPPLAGFISKWYLGIGGMASGQYWVIAILVFSTLLNAAYFLPVVYTVWFEKQLIPWPKDTYTGKLETHWMLLLPPLVTALMIIIVGFFANTIISPLEWVKLIITRKMTP